MKKAVTIFLVVLIGLAVVAVISHRPLRITYHRLAREKAFEGMRRSAGSGDFNRHTDRMSRHTDALIRLGYLERRTFDLNYLTVPSPRAEQLFDEYRRMYPASSYSVGIGSSPSILDRPVRMPVWEELFRKYDVPAADSNDVEAPESDQSSEGQSAP